MTDNLFFPLSRASEAQFLAFLRRACRRREPPSPLFLGAIGIVTPESGEQNLATLLALIRIVPHNGLLPRNDSRQRKSIAIGHDPFLLEFS